MAFQLESTSFPNRSEIPPRFTGEGDDASPELHWSDPPAGTQSFVLIADDPDAPRGTFTHWVAWDIPATAHAIEEGSAVKSPAHSGTNDFNRLGYSGPMPPPGHGPHRYFFRLYALDCPTLGVRDSASRYQVERAMQGHVRGVAELQGRYERGRHAAARHS